MSLKETAFMCNAKARSSSVEQNSGTSPTFSSVVLLAMNLKKSPWLLSRCKENSFGHVHFIQKLIGDSDSIKVIVKLVKTHRMGQDEDRYLALISSRDENEEINFVLGINVAGCEGMTVGLILPITMETDICLDGDGGFFVSNSERKYSFQPVSIQEMWSAIQALVKCALAARNRNQQCISLEYYNLLPKSDIHQVAEWERVEDDLSSRTNEVLSCEPKENFHLKTLIRRRLQEILVNEDLDKVTSKEIRDKLEEKLKTNVQEDLGMSLGQYKQFVDEETILVMRQMDSPSQILDFLYLGSEWNASNFEELKRNKVGYILNVTKEIENFFPKMFKYCNVRVYDYEETELLKHWNSTFKFISEAIERNSNVLVHCKMGISRSASTVIAFLMKHFQWNLEEAYQFVKQKRSCVQPNPGFMQQLITYQGILDASNHRHNKLFRSRSINSINKIKDVRRTAQKLRPRSNAEQRRPKIDESSRADAEVTPGRRASDRTESDNFVIVDADETYRDAPDSFVSLDARPEHNSFDDSKLSTSSVLRQWSIQSPGIPSQTEKAEAKEDADAGRDEEIFYDSALNPIRRSSSWPLLLDVDATKTSEGTNFESVVPVKGCVRFDSRPTNKSRSKKPLRRFYSVFHE